MIVLILLFCELRYTFESQLTEKDTFAITRDHWAYGIGQPIYAEGYLLIRIVDISTAEDCLG